MKVAVVLAVCLLCFSAIAHASAYSEAKLFSEMYAQEITKKDAVKAPDKIMIKDIYAAQPGNQQQHIWEAGAEVYYFSYREPDVMRENGMMYGLNGSYAYHNNFMLKAEGRGGWGKVDYKNSGTINDITDYTFEFRGLGGYDFTLSEKSTLTPFIGVGYRYLNDDTSGKTSSTGASGYERESNYIYTPVGVEGLTRFNDGWSLGASVEYDVFWWGRQISHLSDVNAGYSDVRNTQKKGYGVRGSVKLKKRWENLDFVLEPFARYWNIAKSETSDVSYAGTIIGYGYEPRNTTTEYGIKFGVNF